MTSQPQAPGAAAVYLYREEITEDREGTNTDTMDNGSDRRNYRSVYVRLKILSEAGLKYADVEAPFDARTYSMGAVQGRTIHRDGTVVPFTGKPLQKEIAKAHGEQAVATVFTMPDVQVGSIIEYRYFLRYNSSTVVPPQWLIQQELFVRSAHYYFRPTKDYVITSHDNQESGVAYTASLPPGVAVKYSYSEDAYELNIKNVAPLPDEEWMPPVGSLAHRVLFYYTGAHTPGDYWNLEGHYWVKEVDGLAAAGKMKDAVGQIVSPGDTDKQKAQKIYDAVMLLQNTSFTAGAPGDHDERSGAAVDQREYSPNGKMGPGSGSKTAEDTWRDKRGSADDIAMLFIGLARAAGLNAYAMAVTNRSRAHFNPNYLTMDQLDDEIAIVEIDGKEQFFDPGSRYCAFGLLNWTHTSAGGLREYGGGVAVSRTPGFGYEDAETIRSAQLDLDDRGSVQGVIRVKLSGAPALYWRQLALRTDEAEVKRQFERTLGASLPAGVQVRTNHFVGLADWKEDLLVLLDVSGTMGTVTAKRVILPAGFFEASDKPLFVNDTRDVGIDLHYPSLVQDTVVLNLPKDFAVESVPKDMRMPLPKNALYVVKYTSKPGSYGEVRQLIVANPFYEAKDYPDLKDFYQKVNVQDGQQMILTAGAAAGGQ